MPGKRTLAKTVLEKTVRLIFRLYFKIVHRIEIEGLENVPKNTGKLIIISNHASYFDGPIIWAFLNLDFKILVDRATAQIPFLKPFMKNDFTIQIDPLNPYCLKEVIDIVNAGTPLLIFPEGRITTTGSFMKIYEGTGFIAYKTEARILPVYLKDTCLLATSKRPGRKKIFSKITMTIGKLQDPIKTDDSSGKIKRKKSASRIYEMMCDMYFKVHSKHGTLAKEFIRICKENKSRIVFNDVKGKKISYKKSLAAAFLLGDYFSGYKDENIGIMLPNLTITALLFMGLQLAKKVPAFLNYAGGTLSMKHAMDLADINAIITSREFLERIHFDMNSIKDKELIFVEDLQKCFKLKHKLTAKLKSMFPNLYYKSNVSENKNTAVILFTSGSEGIPKGVCLTHENIVCNIHQVLSKIDIRESDVVLNALPLFHSFGLTVGMLAPLFANASVFLYVSPLHYRVIPETAYSHNCTIMLGTNTFLNGYSKKANPYDFYSMRYVFCGAEALTDAVFDKYAKTYGIRVMTGYGATECSPVVSINNPLEYEYGSVGKILPGMEYKLKKEEGIDSKNGKAGRLYVKGKNVMKGYLKNETANRKFQVYDKGWYDTGDIVEITENNMLKIVGRLKRFAKISGEMISLTAVEDALCNVFGERKEIVIMAAADERKGEKLIAVVNNQKITLKEIREALKSKGFPELSHPREIKYIKNMPKLGSGKVNYIELKKIIEKQ